MAVAETKPCECCGTPVTRTKTQQSQRKYWTCGRACATKLAISLGNMPGNWSDNPNRGQKETRPCAQCGEPVTRYLSQTRIGRPWYCSLTCRATGSLSNRIAAGEWKVGQKKRRGENFPCATCGKLFYRNKGQQERGARYCSIDCANESFKKTPVVKSCENCGKEMVFKPSRGMQRFCSKRCEAIADIKRPLDWTYNGRFAKLDTNGYVMVWEPDHPNKSFHGWQYIHRLVAELKYGRSIGSNEHVHHINGDKQNFSMENLVVLSPAEHNTITQEELKQRRQSVVDELEEYRRKFGPLT